MKSHLSVAFRAQLARLPDDAQRQARAAYILFERDPFHPSLQFKHLSGLELWSARVGSGYRALGMRSGDAIIWRWIGPHAEYDQILRRG